MKKRYLIGLIMFTSIIFPSCKKDKRLIDAEKIVKEYCYAYYCTSWDGSSWTVILNDKETY